MLHINHTNEIDQLRQMSEELGADFIEEQNAARLEFDNENGVGRIASYLVFPGLVARSYNVKLTKEWNFTKKEGKPNSIYFIYCVEGYYFHKFHDEEKTEKIGNMQNVILSGDAEKQHEIILPAHTHLQISTIVVTLEKFDAKRNRKFRMLEDSLQQFAGRWHETGASRYFGNITIDTSEFARILTTNYRLDIIGKLITEAAVINTVASQLMNHEKNEGYSYPSHGLNNTDLRKLVGIGDYIAENIHEKIGVRELAKRTNLYPKKLQLGCKYLYGESVNNFIQRIRMDRARHFLQDASLNISEVCYKVGISSRSYFSKLFHETYGVLPTEFKKLVESDDYIYELSYRSQASEKLTAKDINTIVQHSIENNKAKNITGALVYHSNTFFQVIEGPKKNILALYDKLLLDDRHKEVTLIWKGVTAKRTFGNWTMAFLTEKEEKNLKVDGVAELLSTDAMKLDDEGVFTNVFWRRVLTILKNKAA